MEADNERWLDACWSPTVHDAAALERFGQGRAPTAETVVDGWRRVEVIKAVLDEIPRLRVRARYEAHTSTVMDLCLGPLGRVASVDYGGRWLSWEGKRLRTLASGSLGWEARRIRSSRDGRRLLVLVNRGASALYQYDAFIVDVGDGRARHCEGANVEKVAWASDGSFAMLSGVLGYRIHDGFSGECVCTDEAPNGLGPIHMTHAGMMLVCVRRNRLGGVELGTRRALAITDLSELTSENRNRWGADAIDVCVRRGLLCIGTDAGSIFVLELRTRRLVARIELGGVQIVWTRAAFDASGRYLTITAVHVHGCVVTHLVYDGVKGRVLGAISTQPYSVGHHARAVFSAKQRRLYAAEGTDVLIAG